MSNKKEKQNKIYFTDNHNRNNNDEIFIVKLLVVGDSEVGKSNIIYRYTKEQFSTINASSAGFEYNVKELEITDKKILVQLWDSAGQEKYRTITKNLFTRVQGIIIVYDITNRSSFENIPKWIKLIKETNDKIPYVIAGNKCDLDKLRVVAEDEAQKFSFDNKIDLYETSAKQNINIIECINNFVQKIVNSESFNQSLSLTAFSLQNISTSSNKNDINKSERCC